MERQKRTTEKLERVYEYLKAHADADGIVETGQGRLSADLGMGHSTVAGCLVRLCDQGKVVMRGGGVYQVVDMTGGAQ